MRMGVSQGRMQLGYLRRDSRRSLLGCDVIVDVFNPFPLIINDVPPPPY